MVSINRVYTPTNYAPTTTPSIVSTQPVSTTYVTSTAVTPTSVVSDCTTYVPRAPRTSSPTGTCCAVATPTVTNCPVYSLTTTPKVTSTPNATATSVPTPTVIARSVETPMYTSPVRTGDAYSKTGYITGTPITPTFSPTSTPALTGTAEAYLKEKWSELALETLKNSYKDSPKLQGYAKEFIEYAQEKSEDIQDWGIEKLTTLKETFDTWLKSVKDDAIDDLELLDIDSMSEDEKYEYWGYNFDIKNKSLSGSWQNKYGTYASVTYQMGSPITFVASQVYKNCQFYANTNSDFNSCNIGINWSNKFVNNRSNYSASGYGNANVTYSKGGNVTLNISYNASYYNEYWNQISFITSITNKGSWAVGVKWDL